jgi:hypothetical protein
MGMIDGYMSKASTKPYMLANEMSQFERLRKDGTVTFFRTANCRSCSKEIHQSKQFCSKSCYEKSEEDGVSKT